jgi:lipopolysaccharide transport system ATP-binding protein
VTGQTLARTEAAPQTASALAITASGLAKSFALVDAGNAWKVTLGFGAGIERFQALDGISFNVPKGQFVGILGRNGAGKSTLLRVAGGVYAPDRGRIAITGALSGLYELGLVGNPQLTGREYATRLISMHGFARQQRNEMLADIHDFSELGDRFDDPVHTYSAGMSARLFFAAATAGNYEVYLIDEILSVGDQHFQSKCWRRIRDRVARGASGVLVTHDWAAIVQMCETTHILDGGRITYSGPSQMAVRRYLYGEAAREAVKDGVACFIAFPTAPLTGVAGTDLDLTLEVKIEQVADVGAVMVVERLQSGFGWENMLMSRAPTLVGRVPGRYELRLHVPNLPLEPANYQISVALVMPDPEVSTRRIILDNWSWLNGGGIPLQVTGEAGAGMALPLRWQLTHGEEPER